LIGVEIYPDFISPPRFAVRTAALIATPPSGTNNDKRKKALQMR
jgi:hypothetical protein